MLVYQRIFAVSIQQSIKLDQDQIGLVTSLVKSLRRKP